MSLGIISMKISNSQKDIALKLARRYAGDGELAYTGAYTVVPTFSDQILLTKNRTLSDDVTVKEITVSRVDNSAGGTTVWIGEE